MSTATATAANPSGNVFNHTMVRVLSAQKSIDFYSKHFGMKHIDNHKGGDFQLDFLAFQTPEEAGVAKRSHLQGILELTENYGRTEPYKTGSEDGLKGFNHVAFSFKGDLEAECERLKAAGVEVTKTPSGGKMKGIAFVKDVDGYSIELVQGADDQKTAYEFDHTCLRVKDPEPVIKSLVEDFGMSVVRRAKFPDMKFDLVFLGYDAPHDEPEIERMTNVNPRSSAKTRAPEIELTVNYDMPEGQSKYFNGNEEEAKGFGHIAIAMPDIENACKRLEERGVKFQKRLTDGKMKHIAFALTPGDNYWVEIIPA
ncbi:Lactoylglutathione lyase [Savitreella phatthalungensis]